MTHRGPFQPLLFCDSVILFRVPHLGGCCRRKDTHAVCGVILGERVPACQGCLSALLRKKGKSKKNQTHTQEEQKNENRGGESKATFSVA